MTFSAFCAVILLPALEQGRPAGPHAQPSPSAYQFFFPLFFFANTYSTSCVPA